jgi:hypothetical protein
MARRPWEPDPPPPWRVGQVQPPEAPWRDVRAKVEEGYGRLRAGTRGLLLPLFTWPLVFDAVAEVVMGRLDRVLAAGIGLSAPWVAVWLLRRGVKGDTNRAALVIAAATFVVAWFGALTNPALAALLAAGGWLGTRLLYDGAVVEAEPPAPPPPPGPLDEARARVARIAAEPRLVGVAGAMAGVLDDLSAKPERIGDARRFLAVHLDGLDRIRARLEAGAEPPPGLPKLLGDLTEAADDLRERIRAEETAALDIQVKVLSERLRQEGYG